MEVQALLIMIGEALQDSAFLDQKYLLLQLHFASLSGCYKLQK
jgi:hypothetical protein